MTSPTPTPPEPKPPKRLAIFISGRGSNMEAIHKATQSGEIQGVEVALIISSTGKAAGLHYAATHHIPSLALDALPHSEDASLHWDARVLEALGAHRIDAIALAGFMKILPTAIIEAYESRILNIHPSLLPKFGGVGMYGMRVHRAVIEAGERESGCTVHLVTPEVDAGPVLAQARLTLAPDESPETLAQRVLALEHALYPHAIAETLNKA